MLCNWSCVANHQSRPVHLLCDLRRLPLLLHLVAYGLLRYPNQSCARPKVDARIWVVGVQHTENVFMLVQNSKFEAFECLGRGGAANVASQL